MKLTNKLQGPMKAKKKKENKDLKPYKAALMSMPKPVHPKKGHAEVAKPQPDQETGNASNQPSIEVQFAQRLASNDPVMRNKAIKKLKHWLEGRTLAVQENEDAFSEMELMRLWKGLYYCFWMSDKPLIQEEVAESIGSMINCFGKNTATGLLFAGCFMTTMGREWFGIDKWRMDKFMMLVRRFVRQCFVFLSRFQWEDDLVDKWCTVVETKCVSANTIQGKKKGKKRKFDSGDYETYQRTSLGFQLHFIDIYLEELAKIGGENLPAETIQILLKPFISELANGDDERLGNHIEEKVFQHLMRQSDLGIAYEEILDNPDDFDEGSDDGEENDINSASMDEDSEDEDGDTGTSMFQAKDPRAGKVDVVLPQLMPDFEKLALELFRVGSDPKVVGAKRDVLYRLTEQFKALSSGAYPLTAELSEDEDDIPKINLKKEAKKAAREEWKRMQKVKEERKNFKLAIKEQSKKKPDQESPDDEEREEPDIEEEKKKKDSGSEGQKQKKLKLSPERLSPSIKGENKKEKKGKKDKKKKGNASTDESPSQLITGEGKKKKVKEGMKIKETLQEEGKKKKDLTEKKKKKKDTTLNRETPKKEKKELNEKTPSPCKKNSPKSPKSPLILSLPHEVKYKLSEDKSKNLDTSTDDSKDPMFVNFSTETPKSKKKKPKTAEGEEIITIKKRKIEKEQSKTPENRPVINKLLANSLPTKQAKMNKKRINFSLMENKCSSLQDVDKSILESPDIPFHADKKPKQGVLKKTSLNASLPLPTTPTNLKEEKQSVAYNTLLNGRSTFMKKRSRAFDFF